MNPPLLLQDFSTADWEVSALQGSMLLEGKASPWLCVEGKVTFC